MGRRTQNLSYSRLERLQKCPKLEYWERVMGLSSPATEAMRGGTEWHGVLEEWYDGCLPLIEDNLALHGMLTAYRQHWGDDNDWQTIVTEQEVCGSLYHPTTRRKVPGVRVKAIIDLIVRDADGNHWIVEHKSKSSIDANYIASLWMSRQAQIYAIWAEQELGIHISGVIYNLAVRPGIKRKVGETDEEFAARRATLKHPDKATQRTGETDDEYLARLAAWYAEPNALRFHREVIVFTSDDLQRQLEEMYALWQQWDWHRKTGVYPRATAQCYPMVGYPCPFNALCAAADPSLLVALWRERANEAEEIVPLPLPELNAWDALTL